MEVVFQQKHVESYHSELSQQLGYKPAPRMLERRAAQARTQQLRRVYYLLPTYYSPTNCVLLTYH